MTEPNSTIGQRTADGAFWMMGMRLSIRLIGIVSVIILARILVPEDFGIVAKASMIAGFLELITEFGLEAALIQNQNTKKQHYDTVWTIHLIRGAVIALVLLVLASPAARFLHEPVLKYVLLFYALSALLAGMENVGIVDFRKKLDFNKDFMFSVIKKFIGFLVTISVALIWKTYWAFVAGVLAMTISGVIASFAMSPFRPSVSLSEWRSLYKYSKWILLTGVLSSVSQKLDTFILSRFSTTEMVGRYTVAYEISSTASTELAMPLARATMPGLSKLGSDPDRFRILYTKSILILMAIAIPAAVGMAALAEPLTYLLLGSKWAEAADLIAVLSFYGIVRSLYAVSASAYLSSGAVDKFAKLAMLSLFLRIFLLSFGFQMGGVLGMAYGVVGAGCIHTVVSLGVQHHERFVDASELLKRLWRVVLSTALMYYTLSVTVPKYLDGVDSHTVIGLFVLVALGALIYFGSLAILWALSRDRRGPEWMLVTFALERIRRKPVTDNVRRN